MQLPGFAADVSLYETSQSYRAMATFMVGNGVLPQQTKGCGRCYIHADGNCAKDCVINGRDLVIPCPVSACACGPCICTKNCNGVHVPC